MKAKQKLSKHLHYNYKQYLFYKDIIPDIQLSTHFYECYQYCLDLFKENYL